MKRAFEFLSFTQIWKLLDPQERGELTRHLMLKGCLNNPVTITLWGNGKTAPPYPFLRWTIRDWISENYGIEADERTLFPPQERKPRKNG